MKLPCRNLWKIAASCSFAACCWGQMEAGEAARNWRQAHEPAILAEFFKLLEIPNIARDLPNIERNAALIQQMMERRSIAVQLLRVPNAPPVVYGEIKTPGATQTIVFYAHYDGQPVDSKQWITPPFQPVLREGRLYARSASDDKAPIIAQLTALDALKAAGIKLKSNLKFFYEGEEEAGSVHVASILQKYKALLKADLWLFCDGPVHQNRQQQIVFGARGSMGMNLTVYGPKRELHSGHYGNWAPNPAWTLTHLLASMKDMEGKVLIKDFYKGVEPYGVLEQKAISENPNFDKELKDELWLNTTEGSGRLEERIGLPSLNIRGLESANVGADSRNVIPTTATASLDIRLVKGLDSKITQSRVLDHLRGQGFFVSENREPSEEERKTHSRVVKVVVSDGYNAARIAMDHPLALKVVAVVEAARGKVLRLPMLGGSLPLSIFEQELATPLIVVPIANHDNNQHGHNENIRLQNLWDGIVTMAALLAM